MVNDVLNVHPRNVWIQGKEQLPYSQNSAILLLESPTPRVTRPICSLKVGFGPWKAIFLAHREELKQIKILSEQMLPVSEMGNLSFPKFHYISA